MLAGSLFYKKTLRRFCCRPDRPENLITILCFSLLETFLFVFHYDILQIMQIDKTASKE